MPKVKTKNPKQKRTAAKIRSIRARMRKFKPRPIHYILVGKKPVPCRTLRMLKDLIEEPESKQRVASTQIGRYRVSTVFLMMDHNPSGVGPPVLFETMIFGPGDKGIYQDRYSTWAEAERGHARAIKHVKGLTSAKRSARPASKVRSIRRKT